jgi:hypothetical protein
VGFIDFVIDAYHRERPAVNIGFSMTNLKALYVDLEKYYRALKACSGLPVDVTRQMSQSFTSWIPRCCEPRHYDQDR